ncbi:methyltransferase domain-containing protein [Rhizobium sp. RU36D]|uniref:class I SAM-dependent DNA methyltransferase n=1 Tax=Rhizobium sp. RU36D TaxID=1907415 RepID=UPI0009D7F48C|nr:methyltransferase domain-containing protein [Rhizobium sp. RU36D]SMD19921.1 Predicted methyltransferase, contains TPR repeat [Rhizobium sp. RU36D]
MPPTQFSSGDAIADRRADYARMLSEGGDPAAAAELMEQALDLAPDWAAGHLRLADYREKAGDLQGAAEALRRVLDLDPEDIFGASLKLAVIGARDAPQLPPSRYVEALFDDYADRFETALLQKLDYSVPRDLAALLAGTVGERKFAVAVDLGCGTGLMGVEIADRVERLEGFDLSANMLAKAAEKGIYHQLAQADLSQPATESGLFGEGLGEGRADLIVAADVMMYLGNLEAVFDLVAALATKDAILAFSVEDGAGEAGYALAESLRYRHDETYVRALIARHGFDTLETRRQTIRMDGGKPVAGILFIARRMP